MDYGHIGFIALCIALAVIILEFLWLRRLSKRHESCRKRRAMINRKIDDRLDLIFKSSDRDDMRRKILGLKKFAEENSPGMRILCSKLLDYADRPTISQTCQNVVSELIKIIKPMEYYKLVLKNGDPYQKARICREIANHGRKEAIPDIRPMADSKNKDLSYNSAMALSVLGDEGSVVDFILNCEKNYEYSHRIIIEVLEKYAGNISSLARRLIAQGDEYIRVSVIKGIAKYRLSEFEETYLQGLNSRNMDMKIACIRALGKIADPKSERSLIIETHDLNWQVRAAAVEELSNFQTETGMKAVTEAIQDTDWWVRHNAAKSLIRMDASHKYVYAVLKGYDKYASDAVKNELSKAYNMGKGEVAKV